ncbi:YusW family protein [Halobacillus litoralis]|nr:YusW family protein [Halobacillus litoralis]
MIRSGILTFVFFSILIAAGCGGTNNKDEAMDTKKLTNIENIAFDTQQTAPNAFRFTKFDMEVDYVDTLSYGIDYEHENQQTKAVIHEIGEERISGEEALDQLTPHFQEMSFDEDTPEDEVIEEVLNILGLDQTFKEFKLEVVFSNGVNKEYES